MEHLTESLDRVMQHNIVQYAGCLIYRTKGEYVWNRKGYPTIDEARKAVDKSLIYLQHSIKNHETR